MADPNTALHEANLRRFAEPSSAGGAPELPKEALHGIAGEFVRIIDPHTESDPAATLVQFLAATGNAIGPRPYFEVERTPHRMNLFVALVGDTSKARKGTSLRWSTNSVAKADPTWGTRNSSGLSSGEGLIQAVRDGSGEADNPQPGVTDKRLFVVEPEFAAVLKRMGRENNTLSAVLRDAWDTGVLQVLTRKDPLRATGAHISIVTHITGTELKSILSANDRSNGLANRFLWASVRRSKLLPEGGDARAIEYSLCSLNSRLQGIIERARGIGAIVRSPRCRELWWNVYPILSKSIGGVLGDVTSRSEAQVTRLSALYAVLDGSQTVEEIHLTAALAVWRFCFESANFIFGSGLGNRLADRILKALAQAGHSGLTRSELLTGLGGHVRAEQLDDAFELLLSIGVARSTTKTGTGGAPRETWFAVDGANNANKAKKGTAAESRMDLVMAGGGQRDE